jgi:hypothetical protein
VEIELNKNEKFFLMKKNKMERQKLYSICKTTNYANSKGKESRNHDLPSAICEYYGLRWSINGNYNRYYDLPCSIGLHGEKTYMIASSYYRHKNLPVYIDYNGRKSYISENKNEYFHF